jgi:hypothetical protein
MGASALARAASPRTTWGQPPSAVLSSEARLPFAESEMVERCSAGQPGAAVPTWFVALPLVMSL